MTISTVLGNWVTVRRAAGLFVLVEEIGGQGELGPFPDEGAARAGLLAYLQGADRPPEAAAPDGRMHDVLPPGDG